MLLYHDFSDLSRDFLAKFEIYPDFSSILCKSLCFSHFLEVHFTFCYSVIKRRIREKTKETVIIAEVFCGFGGFSAIGSNRLLPLDKIGYQMYNITKKTIDKNCEGDI